MNFLLHTPLNLVRTFPQELRWVKMRGRHARFQETSVSKWFLDIVKAKVDSVSARFENARVKKYF